MRYWNFRVFKTERGIDVFGKWIDELPIKARVKITTRIKYLEATEHWKRPAFDKLAGYENLYEIRVVFGVQYRIIGCYGPSRKEFTFLIGAIEKDDKLEPREALKIAETRSKLISLKKHTAEFIS